ncbi:MAG: hypothetical protein IMZ62_12680 [Chloroflexi bacterium]|nr:hypothetical protein [Chloroflexota bacterium]
MKNGVFDKLDLAILEFLCPQHSVRARRVGFGAKSGSIAKDLRIEPRAVTTTLTHLRKKGVVECNLAAHDGDAGTWVIARKHWPIAELESIGEKE